MISCLIIDDEPDVRLGMTSLVEKIADLKLLDTCSDGLEAIDKIDYWKPDLIFLDIQMPRVNGFEVLASIGKPWPQVIFVTAHDDYAIKAFEINAIDYLLKPFTDDRFKEAVQRVTERSASKNANTIALEKFSQKYSTGSSNWLQIEQDRLVVKVDGSIHLVTIHSIRYIEAFDYYIKIHTASKFYLVREAMKRVAEKLKDKGFLRIHKSHIVNLIKIKAIHRLENYEMEVELHCGKHLKVSRNYRHELLDKFS